MHPGDRSGPTGSSAPAYSGAAAGSDPSGQSAEEVVDNLWAALQRSKGQESRVPSDVDTSDRPGDGARTTPPVTPAQRGPGTPAGSSAPTGTGTSSTPASGSSSTPPSSGTNPTFGTPSSAPGSATGSPVGGPSGSPVGGPSGSPASAGGGSGLVPAGPDARTGLNGARDAASPARPDAQPLLDAETAATVRERWFGVQSAFVDDPESAVREASVVLEDSIAAIGRGLDKLRRSVTDAAEAADGTEDLRVALLRHREVIGRLLQL